MSYNIFISCLGMSNIFGKGLSDRGKSFQGMRLELGRVKKKLGIKLSKIKKQFDNEFASGSCQPDTLNMNFSEKLKEKAKSKLAKCASNEDVSNLTNHHQNNRHQQSKHKHKHQRDTNLRSELRRQIKMETNCEEGEDDNKPGHHIRYHSERLESQIGLKSLRKGKKACQLDDEAQQQSSRMRSAQVRRKYHKKAQIQITNNQIQEFSYCNDQEQQEHQENQKNDNYNENINKNDNKESSDAVEITKKQGEIFRNQQQAQLSKQFVPLSAHGLVRSKKMMRIDRKFLGWRNMLNCQDEEQELKQEITSSTQKPETSPNPNPSSPNHEHEPQPQPQIANPSLKNNKFHKLQQDEQVVQLHQLLQQEQVEQVHPISMSIEPQKIHYMMVQQYQQIKKTMIN